MWNHFNASSGGSTVLNEESPALGHGWNVWQSIEGMLCTVGLGLIASYGAARLECLLSYRAAMKEFAAVEEHGPASAGSYERDRSLPPADMSTWDENRARAYRESQSKQIGVPMGVLQIPNIHLAVPLLEGTDDLTLNHAVGHIAGTARPGEQGNIGIAGHRDGFFRGLKDVRLGDAIELRTAKGTDKYVIDQIRIVTPDNAGVLKRRPVASLTLVTCYPFYFIGSAPERYVVMASLTHETSSGPGSSPPGSESPTSKTNKETQ
ncbi:MAG: class D sortase [Terracidiphilus sp.]|jgi:sortase A